MSQVTANDLSYLETVEEHFRVTRGTRFFRLSPLDWALVAAWQEAGIPLEAVLRGIDRTFEKWRKRRPQARTQMVNSIRYCAQAVAAEAQALANATPAGTQMTEPYSLEEIREFIARNASALRSAGHAEVAETLEAIDVDTLCTDLQQLEHRLCAIEEKMIDRLRDNASEEVLSRARIALDRDLKSYRGRMTSDQLSMLEKHFLERWLLESASLPRLSLFYMR